MLRSMISVHNKPSAFFPFKRLASNITKIISTRCFYSKSAAGYIAATKRLSTLS